MHLPFTGGEIQGTLAEGGRISNRSTNEPTTGELVTHLRDLLGSALATGSRNSYRRAWLIFAEFHGRFFRTATLTLPLPYTKVAPFISYLSAKQLTSSTINSYLSAFSYVRKLMGRPDRTKSFLIQKLLTPRSRQRTARLPTRDARLFAYPSLDLFYTSLYSAMFLLAFYGFFRIGELAAKSAGRHCSLLQFKDLTFLMSDGTPYMIKLTITDFKHNTSRKPFEILIEREAAMPFCPVQGLINYCQLRGVQPGPLFCHQNLEPITVYQFNTELSRCLTFCGLDTKKYKGHSFRIGAASHAADKGFSDAQIRTLGRWKSDAFKSYIRSKSLHAN